MQQTNEQKAVIIATREGWVERPHLLNYYLKRATPESWLECKSAKDLAHLYLTDLNYLVPVAVKVFQQLPTNDIWGRLYDAYTELTKTPEGTYQPLFDAVYNAIVYLENQNRKCNR